MTSASWRERIECWRTARLLQRHLDGQLGLLSSTEISAHLRRCRRCGMEADEYRSLRAALLTTRTDAAVEAEAVERLSRFASDLANAGTEAGSDERPTLRGS